MEIKCSVCDKDEWCKDAFKQGACAEFTPHAGYEYVLEKSHSKFYLDSYCGKCRFFDSGACTEDAVQPRTYKDREACYWYEEI